MLRVMRRGGGVAEALLTAEHDAALRAAFGRAGRTADRAAGAAIVAEHYSVGRWFACDCLGEVTRRPILVPVLGAFVRRHVDERWPEHAEWCDFYRDASAQAAVSASYGRDAAIGLVRGLAGDAARCRPDVVHRGGEQRRSRLARLLFRLLDGAGLATFRYGQTRTIAEQFTALRRAAASVELEHKMPVSSALCTYRPALQEFVDRIAAMPASAFRKTGNPHGVFIGVARSAARGMIEPIRGDPIAVAGEIAIFGERDGRDGREAGVAARAPYLMACLVGRRAPRSRVEVLRAYLHPCMSERWLFPVDSNLERQTMMQLVALGRWFDYRRGGVPLTVHKPLWDLDRRPETIAGAEVEAHEPIIPDFIVEAGEAGAAKRAVVETMGYAEAAYRARKQRLRSRMEELAGARVVEHDFHVPEGPQKDRDSLFWFACRAILTGGRAGVPGSND